MTDEERKANREKVRAYSARYRAAHPEKVRASRVRYRAANREKIKARHAKYRAANRDRERAYNAAWRKTNREKVRAHKARYRAANRDRERACYAAWQNNAFKTNPQFKLSVLLRTRLRDAIRGDFKAGSSVRDLGCSIAKFKLHIEKQFLPGMTWENWSFTGWHLDHIKPLASFDLTDRAQYLEACHFSNYQPLWAPDNLAKNDRLDWKPSPALSPVQSLSTKAIVPA